MPLIRFTATLIEINSQTILRLPEEASLLLPSRGMVMVRGTINGESFQTALEPDGKKGHWFAVDKTLQNNGSIAVGDIVTLEIDIVHDWPDPHLPADFKAALLSNPIARDTWDSSTVKGRWEYVRWINGTKNPDTRRRRIDVALSKLRDGKKRPCCFNAGECTDQSVSKSGVLLDPATTGLQKNS